MVERGSEHMRHHFGLLAEPAAQPTRPRIVDKIWYRFISSYGTPYSAHRDL